MKTDREPTRLCVVTKERAPQDALLRLVLDPEGRPLVDVRGKGPGRGVYVQPGALVRALHAKTLARSFKGRAQVLDEARVRALLEQTLGQLEQRLLDVLGLARRAGRVAIGMDPVLRRLAQSSEPAVLVLANDLARRSQERIEQAVLGQANISRIEGPNRATLGGALGRETVGVLLVEGSPFRQTLLREAERASALRASMPEVDRDRAQTKKDARTDH